MYPSKEAMAADQTFECSYSNEAFAGTMAGMARSLKTGRLKVAMSRMLSVGLGVAGEARRTLWTLDGRTVSMVSSGRRDRSSVIAGGEIRRRLLWHFAKVL